MTTIPLIGTLDTDTKRLTLNGSFHLHNHYGATAEAQYKSDIVTPHDPELHADYNATEGKDDTATNSDTEGARV